MAEQKKSYVKELTKGFLIENPVLRLVLGTCPTLATSTSVVNGVGMGIAATIVLICSNVVISALRKVIPAKARIPAYIVIIASFVTMVQMLVKAFVPALDQSLGVFLPLIVVNCIILGRAEAYASKNPVLLSAIDGLGMGIGFTAALFLMGTVREVLGAGTFLSGIDTMLGAYIDLGSFKGFDFTEEIAELGLVPMTLFILPAGGFFVFGILMAVANRLAERKGLQSATLNGCKGCPHAAFCNKINDGCDEIALEQNLKEEAEKGKGKREKGKEKCSEEIKEEVKEEVSEKVKEEVKKDEKEPVSEDIKEPEKETVAEEVKKDVKDTVTEEIKEDTKDTVTEEITQTSVVSNEKKSRKKNRKRQKPAAHAVDLEPVPEVVPEFLKKDIEKNKDKEEVAE